MEHTDHRKKGKEKGMEGNKKKSIMHNIIWFTKKHRKIMQYYLEETGVFQSQHHILMEISRNPNITQKDLAKSLDISTAVVTVTLKKLESGGYINRVMDRADNRSNLITMTEKGNEVVAKSHQIFKDCDEKILQGFSEEELETLANYLQRMNANLDLLEKDIKS